jgi:hypothetical protein
MGPTAVRVTVDAPIAFWREAEGEPSVCMDHPTAAHWKYASLNSIHRSAMHSKDVAVTQSGKAEHGALV